MFLSALAYLRGIGKREPGCWLQAMGGQSSSCGVRVRWASSRNDSPSRAQQRDVFLVAMPRQAAQDTLLGLGSPEDL